MLSCDALLARSNAARANARASSFELPASFEATERRRALALLMALSGNLLGRLPPGGPVLERPSSCQRAARFAPALMCHMFMTATVRNDEEALL